MEGIPVGITKDLSSKGRLNVHLGFHFSHSGFPVSAVIQYRNEMDTHWMVLVTGYA